MQLEFGTIKNEIKNNISALVNNSKIEEAETLLEQYFKIDNNDVEAYSMKGVINILKENYEEAETILKEGNKVDNKYFDIHYNLAYVEELLGKVDEASFYYNLAFQLCNDDGIKEELRKKLDYLKDEFDINIKDINRKYYKNINSSIKKILFIQNIPCIRTNKVARALKERDIQVDIAYLTLHPADVYKDIELPYTNIYKITDINFVIDFINNSDYDILYSSNEPDYLTVLFTATNKPIVHDTHDMMSLRSDITVEQVVHEYIANVKSNGNIYVNSSIRDIAVQKFNLVDKPILSLHSFIEKDQLPNKYLQKLSAKDNEIHCVFEGGLQGIPGHHRFLEPIFLKLAKNKIHVHLHCPVDGEYLKNLLKKSKYIHYEGVTSPKKLIVEMTKYDVGLAIFNLNERNKLFLDTAFPNKIWDYLAAGLPILFADLTSFKQFAEESKVGKVLNNNEDIREQVKDVSKIKIDNNFLQNKKWIMNEVADNIINFLREVKNLYNCDKNNAIDFNIKKEKNVEFYDDAYKKGGYQGNYFQHYLNSFYIDIWKSALEIIKRVRNPIVIDIGCGPGQFANLLFDNEIVNYKGIDFSKEAIESAKQRNTKQADFFSIDNVYTSNICGTDYNIAVILEVLEHIDDDILALSKIRKGTKVIFSVPNFNSDGHVRWFNSKEQLIDRYGSLVEIENVCTFNVSDTNKIYLVEGKKK